MGCILENFQAMNMPYELEIISMDSIHLAIENTNQNEYAVIIADEMHLIGGAYPKPSNRAEQLRKLMTKNKFAFLIMLSGTPSPETKAQLFHQFWVHPEHDYFHFNFYQWAKINCEIKQKFVGSGVKVNDYSHVKNDLKELDKYFISVTQKDAEFATEIKEHIITLPLPKVCEDLITKLKNDRVIVGKTGTILADTGVKLQSKIHQMSSGTVKLEEGTSVLLSKYKAEYIWHNFKGLKLVIFYLFKEEYKAIKEVLGDLVSDTKETQHIALQIQSGARAITLKEYEAIIYYNIPFSAELYWQSRDRMSYKEREENNVYWLFSDKGIESKVYKAVQKKKDYTIQLFNKDYAIREQSTGKGNKATGGTGLLCFETPENQ
jgi:hypothetical protein